MTPQGREHPNTPAPIYSIGAGGCSAEGVNIPNKGVSVNHITSADRQQRIIELAALVQQNAERAKRHIRLTIEQAVQLGRLLIEEKQTARAAGSSWGVWFGVRYSRHLSERTARHYAELARRADQNLPEPNMRRVGMLALELMPQKHHPTFTDNPRVIIKCNHMAAVMRLEAVIREIKAKYPTGLNDRAYAQRMASDLSRVKQFIAWVEQQA